VPNKYVEEVMKDIDKLHYCTTDGSFEITKQKVEAKWKKLISLNQFRLEMLIDNQNRFNRRYLIDDILID
jgi:hypothetical protein